jgi:hypothetical protein
MRCFRYRTSSLFLVMLLVAHTSCLAADESGETEKKGLQLFDTPSFALAIKNISQEQQSGDSQFGLGLDWKYSFEHQLPKAVATTPDPENADDEVVANSFAMNISLSGEGFVSLGDSQDSRSEAEDASNFNSISNRLRYSGFLRHLPPQAKVSPRMPGESFQDWRKRTGPKIRRLVERDAEGYSAIDFGFHAESESDQDFDDTQIALGGSVTAASGLATQYLLYPLKFLVPNADEYGDVIQSPQVFLAMEQVLSASQREQLDGASDDEFTRFRLELGWTTELLVSGLYPFVKYHHYNEISADSAIKAAGKASTNFYEVGLNYYVGDRIEALRKVFGGDDGVGSLISEATGMSGLFSQGTGPFVTFRYASGELPPYLESDHQASVGLGIVF